MRRIILLFVLALVFFSSCSTSVEEEKNTVPENLISRDQMVIVLADIHIAEAYVDNLRKSGHQTKDSSMAYFERVFRKNDIDQSDFEESLLFYKKDMQDMEYIYTDVITRINELKAKNEEIILEMKLDSIRQDSIIEVQRLTDSINTYIDSLNLINDTIFVEDSLSKIEESNIQL